MALLATGDIDAAAELCFNSYPQPSVLETGQCESKFGVDNCPYIVAILAAAAGCQTQLIVFKEHVNSVNSYTVPLDARRDLFKVLVLKKHRRQQFVGLRRKC